MTAGAPMATPLVETLDDRSATTTAGRGLADEHFIDEETPRPRLVPPFAENGVFSAGKRSEQPGLGQRAGGRRQHFVWATTRVDLIGATEHWIDRAPASPGSLIDLPVGVRRIILACGQALADQLRWRADDQQLGGHAPGDRGLDEGLASLAVDERGVDQRPSAG